MATKSGAKRGAAKPQATRTPSLPASHVAVRYVGRKPVETDHLYGTGLTWEADGEQNIQMVPRAAAAKMVRNHPDVWALAEADDLADLGSGFIEPEQEEEPEPDQTLVPPLANLDTATRAELEVYAQRGFGKTFAEQETDDAVRDQVRLLIERQKFNPPLNV